MKKSKDYLTIGDTAQRSGVATSTLRFYETRGLINSIRVTGNHRRYHRAMLRRIAIIRVAQTLGLSLREIAAAFENLPDKRTATRKDWAKLSTTWGQQLDRRIADLQNLRDRLSGCIGCGCLSLQHCSLYNADDEAADLGSGPRYLLGDSPSPQ
jgi:MerR family redox-sensitive transcriptional activator SoxR